MSFPDCDELHLQSVYADPQLAYAETQPVSLYSQPAYEAVRSLKVCIRHAENADSAGRETH